MGGEENCSGPLRHTYVWVDAARPATTHESNNGNSDEALDFRHVSDEELDFRRDSDMAGSGTGPVRDPREIRDDTENLDPRREISTVRGVVMGEAHGPGAARSRAPAAEGRRGPGGGDKVARALLSFQAFTDHTACSSFGI